MTTTGKVYLGEVLISGALVTSTDAGLAPASGGGTTNFLRADGTWAAPAGGGGSYTEHGPTRFYAFDDMMAQFSANEIVDDKFVVSLSGTGASQLTEPPSSAPSSGVGWVKFNLGTTAAGRSFRLTQGLTLGGGDFVLNLGVARYGARLQVPTLSNGTDAYTSRFGFMRSAATDGNHAVFFRYTDSINGGRWQAVTRRSAVETAVDTGVTVATGTTYVLHIEVDASIPQAVFKIDGSTVATITTNIPDDQARAVGAGISGVKSSGTSSTIFALVDYQWVEQLLPGRT